ncbi:MAG: glycosyltransferase family 4 protein [Pseudomonadota bacterium]
MEHDHTLNILMVADVSIGKVVGGAERALFEHTTRLALMGHSVHVLTRTYPWHTSHRENVDGVQEWRFDFDDRSFLQSLYSTVVKSRRLFDALCKRVTFDIINFHQPFSALGVISSPNSKGIKKVYTCHSLSFEEFQSRNPRPDNLFGRCLYTSNFQLRRAVEKIVLQRSDKIVVLSDFTRGKLVCHYSAPDEKIVLIPGGVDLERFKPSANRTAIRKRLHIPARKVVLFVVRNLVSRMGLENLLHAVSKAAKDIPNLYLVVGGRGPLKEKLVLLARELSIENRIRFAGFIKEEELPLYYQMADLFVLPTKELEGFGLVTVEALASGLPVLGTPVGGTKEILTKLDPHLLFRDVSADAMAESILGMVSKLKEDKKRKRSLPKECRRFAETYYSWDDKIASLEKLFRTLLS